MPIKNMFAVLLFTSCLYSQDRIKLLNPIHFGTGDGIINPGYLTANTRFITDNRFSGNISSQLMANVMQAYLPNTGITGSGNATTLRIGNATDAPGFGSVNRRQIGIWIDQATGNQKQGHGIGIISDVRHGTSGISGGGLIAVEAGVRNRDTLPVTESTMNANTGVVNLWISNHAGGLAQDDTIGLRQAHAGIFYSMDNPTKPGQWLDGAYIQGMIDYGIVLANPGGVGANWSAVPPHNYAPGLDRSTVAIDIRPSSKWKAGLQVPNGIPSIYSYDSAGVARQVLVLGEDDVIKIGWGIGSAISIPSLAGQGIRTVCADSSGKLIICP